MWKPIRFCPRNLIYEPSSYQSLWPDLKTKIREKCFKFSLEFAEEVLIHDHQDIQHGQDPASLGKWQSPIAKKAFSTLSAHKSPKPSKDMGILTSTWAFFSHTHRSIDPRALF